MFQLKSSSLSRELDIIELELALLISVADSLHVVSSLFNKTFKKLIFEPNLLFTKVLVRTKFPKIDKYLEKRFSKSFISVVKKTVEQ